MSFNDIITSTNYASSQAQAAAKFAKETYLPNAEAKYREELALAIANLAIGLNHLTSELHRKGVI